MIHYISPFRADKNIGKGINDAINQLMAGPDDWIVHVDQDVLFLLPDTKRQIELILETGEFDILGCMTNRVGLSYQCSPGMFNEDSITAHQAHALNLQKEFYYGVVRSYKLLAAFMLCFRVSTWSKQGGFPEKSIQFDALFTQSALRSELRLGIMTGVYVLHLYRWGALDPKREYSHLINK